MLKLPQHSGEKPKTSPDQPHDQLDQNPPAEIYAKLKEQAFALPQVERRPSELSVPGAEALWLSEENAHHRQAAFMFGGEFAHIHPPYDGSMHMTLPEEDVRELLDKGWGEMHPNVIRGQSPRQTVLCLRPAGRGGAGRDRAEASRPPISSPSTNRIAGGKPVFSWKGERGCL